MVTSYPIKQGLQANVQNYIFQASCMESKAQVWP